LTLTGSGGVGKTRLALQAAADALESFPQGVWFIELAALTEAHRVPQTVATILQVREEANRPLLQTLTEYCREKRLLLVLDNCEHLVETCAELADTLLRSCPELKILATSREALAIAGEQTYRVPSLSLPDPKLTAGITPERLSEYEAVRLFLERARLTRADFLMTATNAPAIASLCQRLDGIPLALELAAARVRSLSVEEIDTRLNNVFRLLTGGSRTALPRQQTLRAAIDWSYNLLAPAEQTLFRRLAAFHGGWTLEAAETVVAFSTDGTETLEEGEVLDVLTTLCDRSLVVAEVRGGATRYRLLDIVRQYAAEKATDTDEGSRCAERHLDWFARWTEAATPHLMGPEIGLWLDRLEADHENLRAALNHSFSKKEPDHAEIGLRLAGALVRFWSVRGYPGEGRDYLRRALDATPNTPTKPRANALNGAGNLAYQMGDYAQARTYHQACLEIREQIGDHVGVAGSLNNLGNVAHDVGEYAEAKSLLERSLEINRALGDQRWQAYNLNGLGSVLSGMENQEAARDCFAQAVAAAQAVGDRFVETNALANLGMMQRFLGDLEAARWSLEAALSRADELGYRGIEPTLWSELGWIARKQHDGERAAKWYQKALKAALEQGLKPQIIAALENIAFVLAEQKHENEAVQLFGFAAKERERLGIPQIPLDVPEYEQYYSRLQNALSAEVWQTLWNRGQALLLSEAVEIAIL
jgi:predicted ATPase